MADPRTPSGQMNGVDLEVGDLVDVPGNMYGIVKFVGSVRGKAGRFVGVELNAQFAAKGKNDGDVEGVQYFATTIPGAGIFLPIHRAEKRTSPAASLDSFPNTPNTPSHSTLNGQRTIASAARTPPTPALPSKFSQMLGHGAVRPTSPQFKAKRPSLGPRPESPFRKPPPNLAPTPARGVNPLSQSVRGGRPTLTSSTSGTPGKPNLRASTSTRPTPTPRPYSRTGSRLGHRPDAVAEEQIETRQPFNGRATSTSSVKSFSQPLRSPSRLGSAGGSEVEIQRLKQQLADRDRRLDEQAVSLAEMEASVKELSSLLPADGAAPGDGESAAQLRQMLREKNEKITVMTSEFDAHRADFRSTLDSLEMASTETERVYEEQKRDLTLQLTELAEQNVVLRERVEGLEARVGEGEDFEGVASQLKQLEELVAELEEGLEESRRGEAEARGEVEFLRGEVERGRSELSRSRELEAKTMAGAGHQGKEDEIRGLKAIIHSLSSGPSPTRENGHVGDAAEVQRLQEELEASSKEKAELEKELGVLRRASNGASNGHTNGYRSHSHNRNESTRTVTAPSLNDRDERGVPIRQRSGTLKPTFAEHARRSGMESPTLDEEPLEHSTSQHEAEDTGEGDHEDDGVYCEMCESREHDTLECTKLQKSSSQSASASSPTRSQHRKALEEEVYSPGKENEGLTNGKSSANGMARVQEQMKLDEDKWCALCERDGHLAFDCPEEQY